MQAIERVPAGDQALRVGLAHAGCVLEVDGHCYSVIFKLAATADNGFGHAIVVEGRFSNHQHARRARAHAAAPGAANTLRLPFDAMPLTTPSASMASIRLLARL